MSGGVLEDFDTEEMAKERAINEQRMVDLKNELMTEIYNLKQQFKDIMEESEKNMTAMFDDYMGKNMLRQSRETLAQMDLKTNTLTDRITKLMDTLQASPLDQNETTSPPRKQQRLRVTHVQPLTGVFKFLLLPKYSIGATCSRYNWLWYRLFCPHLRGFLLCDWSKRVEETEKPRLPISISNFSLQKDDNNIACHPSSTTKMHRYTKKVE
jgi:hypothetical protein